MDIHTKNGRIVAVEETGSSRAATDVMEIDGAGRFALPPLVNAHDHLYSHELAYPRPGSDLAEMRRSLDARDPSHTVGVMIRAAWTELAQGIGVVRDVGAVHGVNVSVARLFGGGILPGPVVVAAARPIVMTGGHVWTFGREADGPWECRGAVREQVKAGAKVIKIMASGGLSHYPEEDFGLAQYTETELAAIVDEARSLGIQTCAHAFSAEAVARAVEAGVDSIEHGVEIADETLEDMRRRGTSYVPTLTNMERVASKEFNEAAGTPERVEVLTSGVVEPHRRTVRRAIEAGVRIGLGTDSTGSYGEEARRLESLGMSADHVVRAATVNGAEICETGSGLLIEGEAATFSLHTDDPRDLRRLGSPDTMVVRGREFHVDLTWLDAIPPWVS